jgi:Fe2+ or Zn2+ uptake regulation protein
MQHYSTLLRGHRLKVTPQRLAIVRYLDEHRTHPTADEIYMELRKENPSLSRTTVYNTIDTLRKEGLIQALTISESELHYDLVTMMHHHLLCKRCGRIIDIDVGCPNLKTMLNGEHLIEEVHGYFKGVCKDCLQKEREEKLQQN